MRTAINVSVITTVRHNIGDDFVREGILSILDDVVKVDRVELVHKHSPVTANYGLENVRNLRASRVIDLPLRMIGWRNRVQSADLLIQSGAPIYWCHPGGPHCADNEWFDPLIRKRFLKDRRGRKFLNLAGGSCQKYHNDEGDAAVCPRCTAYIRELFDVSDLTILRDRLAGKMLNKAGRNALLLPCTSIFARDKYRFNAEKGEYIVLNFMESGGHYTFGQDINAELWRTQFKEIVRVASRFGPVVIACHTKEEEALARIIEPDTKRFLIPNDHVEFMKFYSRATFGIVNRVHAGFMMASFGKPVLVVGNDSRALMIENLGLQSVFVGDFSKIDAALAVESLCSRVPTYRDEIEAIRSSSRKAYVDAIRSTLLV
jgi:hypothetical protein